VIKKIYDGSSGKVSVLTFAPDLDGHAAETFKFIEINVDHVVN